MDTHTIHTLQNERYLAAAGFVHSCGVW